MIIKPFRKYVVDCKGTDELIYRWLLNVEPEFKAWSVVNQNIEVGGIFKGHLILSIYDVTNTIYEETFNENLGSKDTSNYLKTEYYDSWNDPILEENNFAYGMSDFILGINYY